MSSRSSQDRNTPRVVDGRSLAQGREAGLKESVAAHLARGGAQPVLGLVATATDPGAEAYLALKRRACARVGVRACPLILPADAPSSEIIAGVRKFARDPNVSGVFVQYPLPDSVDRRSVLNSIPVEKDVDASSPESVRLIHQGCAPFVPATPAAILRLLDTEGVLGGQAASLVIVAGDLPVGATLSAILENRGTDHRFVDFRAAELVRVVRDADVVVSATGTPHAVDGLWVPDGAVLIDAGYHHADGRGDVDVRSDNVARFRTYVPPRNGLGPLTVVELLANLVLAAERAADSAL